MTSCRFLRQLRAFGVVVALLALLAPSIARAAAYNYSSLVMSADTGEVLYAVNPDMPRYPASLTKMMTLYVLFEALDQGRTQLHDPIYISSHAASQPPSKIGLRAGSQISVENAILALVTKSANDIAAAIAEHLAGTEENFADRMTARAHAIGMSNTSFRNASGLPDTEQMTTARDMAKLGYALIKTYPHYYPYFSTASFYYGGHSHPNHNRMLGSYGGVDGIKTGFINASGFNLVASAKREQGRLIGVVFGARSSGERARIMGNLLDGGFQALQTGVFPERAVDQVLTAERTPERGDSPQRSQDVASAGAGWAIQVGRHGDRLRALQAGKRAADRIDVASANLNVVALRGRKGSVAYLPQLAGLTQTQARSACRSLRASGGSCHMLRPGSAVVTASAVRNVGGEPAKKSGRIAVRSVGETKVASVVKKMPQRAVAKNSRAKSVKVAEIGSAGGFEKTVKLAAASSPLQSASGKAVRTNKGKPTATKLSPSKQAPVATTNNSRQLKKTAQKEGAGKALVQGNRVRQPQS